MKRVHAYILLAILFLACNKDTGKEEAKVFNGRVKAINEVNLTEIKGGNELVVIKGATLIDGNGRSPILNSLVIIKGNKIDFVGQIGDVEIPHNAKIIEAEGKSLLPGLIDAHFHNNYEAYMPIIFLRKGITSVRDPGSWTDNYDKARNSKEAIPRLFLTGPHLDTYPPAYPENSYIIADPIEGRIAVNKFADQGATAIKVYLGLSIEMIEAVSDEAHKRGIPVTAHLETANAKDAILAGLDGIEHITSFGTALLPMQETEKYKQLIRKDKDARNRGRYESWNTLDFENTDTDDILIDFLAERKTFVCPTLAVFEKQYDQGDSIEVNGFANMLDFARRAKKGGVRIVVGSHTWVPYAEVGFAYFRELELFEEAGFSNMEIITSATLENARFLGIEERLGSIEKGKIADLLLLNSSPLENIQAMRNVHKVMLNGVIIE